MMGAMFFSPMPPADRDAAANFKPSRSLPSTRDARALAAQRLPRLIYDFIDGGAGDELGLASNLSDLQRVRLQPRSLAEVNSISLKTSLLGRDWDVPFGIAPMGMCDLAWPGTDHSLAALSQRHNLPLGVSTASSTSLEELLRLSGGRAWFQLYVTGSTQDALALSQRAANSRLRHPDPDRGCAAPGQTTARCAQRFCHAVPDDGQALHGLCDAPALVAQNPGQRPADHGQLFGRQRPGL